jgi:S1-C subfamily serine protease
MAMYNRYPDRPSQGHAWLWVFLLFAGLALVLVWRFWPDRGPLTNPNAAPRPVAARGDLAEDEKTNIKIYKEASPSVVHITSLELQENFLNLDVQAVPRGTGSGFVWDEDGRIVTNNHVIADTQAWTVSLWDRSTYKARLVGRDETMDLAVLKIDAPKGRLRPILIGKSSDLQVGQKVYAIGNPFGLDQTMTHGIVSALGREIEGEEGRGPIKGAIQTDAPINPGNSGGVLLDSSARLIGVNTAIISPSRASAGIGFAIPVDEVNQVVPQLIRQGKVYRPGLGIQPVPDQLARRWGIDGVVIMKVVPDGPAAKAGLHGLQRDRTGHIRLGDVIVAIGGHEVHSTEDMYGVLQQDKIGDTVTVTILRDDERQDKQVTLGPQAR